MYKANAMMLGETFASAGLEAYGGRNSPYIWVHFPGRSSWDVFEEILEKANLVTIPGTGFGPGGEGFIRVSAFGREKTIYEACRRLRRLFGRPVNGRNNAAAAKPATVLLPRP